MRDESYFCRSEVRNIAEEKSTKQFFCQLFTTFFFFSRRFYKGKRKRVSPSQAFFLSPPCFEVVIHHFPKSSLPLPPLYHDTADSPLHRKKEGKKRKTLNFVAKRNLFFFALCHVGKCVPREEEKMCWGREMKKNASPPPPNPIFPPCKNGNYKTALVCTLNAPKKLGKWLFLGGSLSIKCASCTPSRIPAKSKKSLSRKVHCKSFFPFSQAREIEALFSVSYHSRHNFGPKRKKTAFPRWKEKETSLASFWHPPTLFYLSQSIIRHP